LVVLQAQLALALDQNMEQFQVVLLRVLLALDCVVKD
jgi:hypothetical protein